MSKNKNNKGNGRIRPGNLDNSSLIANPSPKSANGLTISLKDFQKHSITISGFNNHFKNAEECVFVLDSGFEKLRHISQYKSLSAFMGDGSLHCHSIDKNRVEFVKKILGGYGFQDERVRELTAENIYQVQLASGEAPARLVFYLVDDSVIFPLFIDTNHQIYPDKKRGYDADVKSKKYSMKQT